MDRGSAGGELRVAIVGLGPKGLFALERLLDHARRGGPQARMEIDLFEPHPHPGAGPVYDPAQPAYLRMNLAADHLDMWWPRTRSVPAREQLSFIGWRATPDDDAYPPRAQVGRYLADGLACMLRHAPPGAAVTLRRSAALALDRSADGWRVTASDGVREYDELLLTAGHGITIDPLGVEPWEHAAPLVTQIFPVAKHLSQIPAGAAVAVRGFALTFLDAALALTEGRGGTFEPDGRPQRLRYRATDADARVITPFSRSGRPMLAKPDPQMAAGVPRLDAIAQAGSERILALSGGFTVAGDLVAILASTAGAALLAATGNQAAVDAAHAWLAEACDGVPPATRLTSAEELERSLQVAGGLRPPDLPWAIGHTWRSVYPALVTRIGAAGLSDAQWPAFRRLAAQMERLAFGPPLGNAAKLLALVDAARVDLTHVAGGRIATTGATTSIRSTRGERRVDVVVDAVLAAPGAAHESDGLLGRLLADGHARILQGRRGLDVGADGGAVGRDGQPTPGLSIAGRATEDCVIGNDTLSRAMHPNADRWALRVARRATSEPAAAAQGAAA